MNAIYSFTDKNEELIKIYLKYIYSYKIIEYIRNCNNKNKSLTKKEFILFLELYLIGKDKINDKITKEIELLKMNDKIISSINYELLLMNLGIEKNIIASIVENIIIKKSKIIKIKKTILANKNENKKSKNIQEKKIKPIMMK